MMKLMIIIGRIETNADVRKRFIKHVLSKHNFDLLFCTDNLDSWINEEFGPYVRHIHYVSNRNISLNYDFSLLVNPVSNAFGGLFGSKHVGNNARFLFNKKLVADYIEGNLNIKQYSHIIITRMDFHYINDYQIPNISHNELAVPVGMDFRGLNDRHTVCHHSTVLAILNQFQHCLSLLDANLYHIDGSLTNPETLFLEYVNALGVNAVRFVHPAFLVSNVIPKPYWFDNLVSDLYDVRIQSTLEYDLAHSKFQESVNSDLLPTLIDRCRAWRRNSFAVRKRVLLNSLACSIHKELQRTHCRCIVRFKNSYEDYIGGCWSPFPKT